MVQEKEKPADAVGGCLPPHGIATSQVFRWRVQFGLPPRETPQLTTVILADRAVNQVSAIGTLRGPGAGARRDDGYHAGDRAAGMMEPRHHQTPQHSIGRLQRAMARNLAITDHLPGWPESETKLVTKRRTLIPIGFQP